MDDTLQSANSKDYFSYEDAFNHCTQVSFITFDTILQLTKSRHGVKDKSIIGYKITKQGVQVIYK